MKHSPAGLVSRFHGATSHLGGAGLLRLKSRWWIGAGVLAWGLWAAAFPRAGGRVVAPPGAYLGQDPPGAVSVVFAPGLVSTDRNEVSCTFGAGGREFFFAVFEPGRGYALRVMSQTAAGWTSPRPAPFSSGYSEVDLFVTVDGRRCFFISKRPLGEGLDRSRAYQIWMSHREDQGWGPPAPLGPTVNTGDRQLFPTLSRDGTLVFGSDRPGGHGGADIYQASPVGEGFGHPVNLGPEINTDRDETDALISPDGRFLVFSAVGREDGLGGGDLYLSLRRADGSWGPARNLGPAVNSPSSDFCPTLSPDGRYFLFTSDRNGSHDIFWVDAAVVFSRR